MSLLSSGGLRKISQSTWFVGWIRRNVISDSVTMSILAFLIVLTLVVFAATTAFSSSSCQGICQVQT